MTCPLITFIFSLFVFFFKEKKEEAISLVRTPWGMSNLPNLTKTGFKKIRREKVA